MTKHLNSDELAIRLRKKIIQPDNKKLLMANFLGTSQKNDISLPTNCHGFGRIHHFRQQTDPRWIRDPLPMSPASQYLGIKTEELLLTQVFQLVACNFRCWYCFADYRMLSANKKFARFIAPIELTQFVIDEKINSQVIDISGGQPDLAPEYALWFLQAREQMKQEKNYFIWVDDNLSNDYLWRFLPEQDIKYMAECKGFARVGCLKGFDQESFAYNTGADAQLFERQIKILSQLVKTGFDQYGYIATAKRNCGFLI